MEKARKEEIEQLAKSGNILRESKKQTAEKTAETIINQQKFEREKQIKVIYEQNRKKLRKELDIVNAEVMQKSQELARLKV
jgi:hypothetical protein